MAGSRRKALRHGAIAALSNQDAAPFPTIAENRVYDSRQDPLIHQTGGDTLPAICVYTDMHKYAPINQGEAPFRGVVDLIIEMHLAGVGGEANTTSELEAKLDDFEDQVVDALFDLREKNALSFRRMYTKIHEGESLRLANNQGNERLAMRALIMTLEIGPRCHDLSSAFPSFDRLNATLASDGGTTLTTVQMETNA